VLDVPRVDRLSACSFRGLMFCLSSRFSTPLSDATSQLTFPTIMATVVSTFCESPIASRTAQLIFKGMIENTLVEVGVRRALCAPLGGAQRTVS
jgi:hypothetical protein